MGFVVAGSSGRTLFRISLRRDLSFCAHEILRVSVIAIPLDGKVKIV